MEGQKEKERERERERETDRQTDRQTDRMGVKGRREVGVVRTEVGLAATSSVMFGTATASEASC